MAFLSEVPAQEVEVSEANSCGFVVIGQRDSNVTSLMSIIATTLASFHHVSCEVAKKYLTAELPSMIGFELWIKLQIASFLKTRIERNFTMLAPQCQKWLQDVLRD